MAKNRKNSIEGYNVAKAQNIDQAFYCFWKEIRRFVTFEAIEESVVLVFPENSLFGNYALFEEFCDR